MPARPAPRDPLPFEPAPLDAQLTGVLRATGAEAARAVDGRRAAVLAEAGTAAGDDVAALVQLARGAGVVAAARGEDLDDLVVTSGRTVHVLRECDQLPGVVLHVRLDRDRGDVGAARRALAAPALVRAVRAVLAGAAPGIPAQRDDAPVEPWPRPVPPAVPAPPVPVPLPVPLPRRSPDASEQEPALVTLTGGFRPGRTGSLAVLALPPVPEAPPAPEPSPVVALPVVSLFDAGTDGRSLATGPLPVVVELPRRTPAPLPVPAPAPAVPQRRWEPQSWSSDTATMRRLLDGLRKLA